MDEIKAKDQVIVKRRIRSGNLIRMGSVIRVDGDKALVHMPIDHTQAVIPVNQLEKTSQRFGSGYYQVNVSPVRRAFLPKKGLV